MKTSFKDSKLISTRAKYSIINFIHTIPRKHEVYSANANNLMDEHEDKVRKIFNALIDKGHIRSDLKGLRNCGHKTRNEILVFLGRPKLEVIWPKLSYKTLKDKIKTLELENSRLRDSLNKVYTDV